MNVLSLLPQIPHWGYLLLTEEDIQTHTQRLREIFAYTLILVGLMPLIFTHLASLCNRWVTCLVPEIEYNRRYPTVRAHEQSHSLFSALNQCDFHSLIMCMICQLSAYYFMLVHFSRDSGLLVCMCGCIQKDQTAICTLREHAFVKLVKSVLLSYVVEHAFLLPVLWLWVDIL